MIAFYLSVFDVINDFYTCSVALIGDYRDSAFDFSEVLLPIFLFFCQKSFINHLSLCVRCKEILLIPVI